MRTLLVSFDQCRDFSKPALICLLLSLLVFCSKVSLTSSHPLKIGTLRSRSEVKSSGWLACHSPSFRRSRSLIFQQPREPVSESRVGKQLGALPQHAAVFSHTHHPLTQSSRTKTKARLCQLCPPKFPSTLSHLSSSYIHAHLLHIPRQM